MIIGYMRNLKKPDSLARTTALIAKSYGIELLYMNPTDVNVEEKKSLEGYWLTINGLIKK